MIYCSILPTPVYKKTALKADNFVVEPHGIFWNTFIDFVLEWHLFLKQVYENSEEN